MDKPGPFVIITEDGKPLAMPDGVALLFESIQAARPWLRPGERVEPAPDDVQGVVARWSDEAEA